MNAMNQMDFEATEAVKAVLGDIENFIDALVIRMKQGGRLFYMGAGTSGRLGVVDASECPPTFGVEHGRVVEAYSGGDSAIRKAVEGAEDDAEMGWRDLCEHGISTSDTVVGITASGKTRT